MNRFKYEDEAVKFAERRYDEDEDWVVLEDQDGQYVLLECQPRRSGSCLQGYIRCSYEDLEETFGEPHERMGDKTSVEWIFKSGDVLFTIYDYKLHCRQDASLFDFHIGGHDPRSVDLVHSLLGISVPE